MKERSWFLYLCPVVKVFSLSSPSSQHTINMATASTFSFNVTDYGVSTVIPDDDVARLMYYLNCVTLSVGLDILQDDLVQFKNYRQLSPARIAAVFKTAIELSPDELLGQLIFRDDKGELVSGSSTNAFISISAACNVVSLNRDIIVAGKVQKVSKVMFFKSSWLKFFYTDPIERIARAVLGTNHCSHCEGKEGICTCTLCPRSSDSKCEHPFDAFFEALTKLAPSSKTRSPSPAKPAQVDPGRHSSNCNGCGWELFTGIRYKCSVCDDYDLCAPCYKRNKHDLAHPFMQINTPGAKPVYLSARAPNPFVFSEPTKSRFSNDPPPYSEGDGRASPPPTPFFYNTMSASELKSYLKERGVTYGDILDKETLCRRVWETHCDCMSVTELNKFLSDNNISAAGCKDISSRRQKAKDAFCPPTRPTQPPKSLNTSATRFRKDDSVVLTGLNRTEMNGKKGTVVSVDHAEGKVLVRLAGTSKTVKIKLENLQEDVEELE